MERRFLLEMYRKMYLIRRVEEKIIELAEKGEVSNLVHLSMGQEACAVGMCSALLPSDYVWSNHRCHAHYLAKGGNLARMFAELAGKETGCAHGWGGSMHLVDPDVNMMGSSAIVGSSIPLAAGSALACKLRGEEGRVSVAFFGDGALESGVFWETLNFAVVHSLPMVFFCENNLYATHSHILKRQPGESIYERVQAFDLPAVKVDGNDAEEVLKEASKAVELARNRRIPVFIEASTYRWREHWGTREDWDLGYRTLEAGQAWKKDCPVKKLRQRLLAKYGSREDIIVANMEKEVEGHIIRAWEFAQNSRLPSTSMEDFREHKEYDASVIPSDRKMQYWEAISEAYVQAMDADSRVFLIGEGVDNITGVYRTVLEAHKKFGHERVIDTPISEAAITGIAIGAAIAGMRPVVIHQRNDFMLLAMQQIVHQAAFWKYMTGGRVKVPVTIASFIARKTGEAAQHTCSWQSIFGHVPGLKVVMPADAYDAKGLTLAAIDDEDPVIVLYHRVLITDEDNVPEEVYTSPIGRSRIARQGGDVTVIAISATVKDALEAADLLLESHNISVEVVDLVSVRPMDKDCILRSAQKTRRVVIVDTGWKTCGLSAEVSAIISESFVGRRVTVPIKRLGMKEFPTPAAAALLDDYHPTSGMIVQAILEAVTWPQ